MLTISESLPSSKLARLRAVATRESLGLRAFGVDFDDLFALIDEVTTNRSRPSLGTLTTPAPANTTGCATSIVQEAFDMLGNPPKTFGLKWDIGVSDQGAVADAVAHVIASMVATRRRIAHAGGTLRTCSALGTEVVDIPPGFAIPMRAADVLDSSEPIAKVVPTPAAHSRLVVLESPYAGDVWANLTYARACIRDSISRGEAPIASHALYTQPGILNDGDPTERAAGIAAGHAWIRVADAVVVYLDRGLSSGMEKGMAVARALDVPIELRTIGGEK